LKNVNNLNNKIKNIKKEDEFSLKSKDLENKIYNIREKEKEIDNNISFLQVKKIILKKNMKKF